MFTNRLRIAWLVSGAVLMSACDSGQEISGQVIEDDPTVGHTSQPTTKEQSGKKLSRFVMYTHCGVEDARIRGHWWEATDPLYGDGGPGSGPPSGWDNPFQEGTLTLTAKDRAEFRANGTVVTLVPRKVDEPMRMCR